MKTKRILALALVFALLSLSLFSCGTNAEEITVTLIITAGEDEILDVDIPLSYADPTVMMLVQEAAILYELNITYNEKGDSVLSIEDYGDTKDENGIDWFWEYTINDVLPDNNTGGKANAQPIVDGDVIHYIYSSFDPASVK